MPNEKIITDRNKSSFDIWGGFSSDQTGLGFFIKSQRAFCILFCEWKEGTIIALQEDRYGVDRYVAHEWMKNAENF